MFAQINLTHIGVVEDVFGSSGGDNSAVIDDVGMFANIQCIPDVVIGDEDAYAPIPQVGDDGFDIVNGYRIDAGEGFVQEDKCGFGGQGPRDLDPPPLASGKTHASDVAQVGDMKFFQ